MDSREYYVDRHDTVNIDFGLEKIYKLLEVLGNPQDSLKVIHIAGTNGKGSVSNYLAHILAYSGMKIGKISSPVIFNKMEFAQIYELFDTVYITDAKEETFNKLVNEFKSDIHDIKPSGYEIQIAFSIKYMLEQQCDIVIVECGMGGSLDATNVFEETLCDVITSISLDHVGMIGDTLEEIVMCKCGIITNNANVVTTSTNENVMDIIKNFCKENNAELIIANKEDAIL